MFFVIFIVFCAEGYEERNEACYECNKGTYKDNSVPGALCLFCEIGLTTESAASTHADNCTVSECFFFLYYTRVQSKYKHGDGGLQT